MSRRLINIAQTTAATGPVSTFTWTDNGLNGGSYTRTYTAAGGSGTGARFTVTRQINVGITSITLFAGGTGYTVGNTLTIIESSSPFDTITITVTAIS